MLVSAAAASVGRSGCRLRRYPLRKKGSANRSGDPMRFYPLQVVRTDLVEGECSVGSYVNFGHSYRGRVERVRRGRSWKRDARLDQFSTSKVVQVATDSSFLLLPIAIDDTSYILAGQVSTRASATMPLLRLELFNFKSYKGTQVSTLPLCPTFLPPLRHQPILRTRHL
jgi:hypothetical protein